MAEDGISLYDACHDAGFGVQRFRRWLYAEEHPERLADWQFAREMFADALGIGSLKLARDGAENVPHATLMVNTNLKVAGKLSRPAWGDKDVAAGGGGFGAGAVNIQVVFVQPQTGEKQIAVDSTAA